VPALTPLSCYRYRFLPDWLPLGFGFGCSIAFAALESPACSSFARLPHAHLAADPPARGPRWRHGLLAIGFGGEFQRHVVFRQPLFRPRCLRQGFMACLFGLHHWRSIGRPCSPLPTIIGARTTTACSAGGADPPRRWFDPLVAAAGEALLRYYLNTELAPRSGVSTACRVSQEHRGYVQSGRFSY